MNGAFNVLFWGLQLPSFSHSTVEKNDCLLKDGKRNVYVSMIVLAMITISGKYHYLCKK